jgi:hypothetical protein
VALGLAWKTQFFWNVTLRRCVLTDVSADLDGFIFNDSTTTEKV